MVIVGKRRKPAAINFQVLGKIEEALECNKTPKQALECAGLVQSDIDNAAADDLMACFAAMLIGGDCGEGDNNNA